MREFETQTAVITGAASGIGKALAIVAAARGMNLLLADCDQSGLDLVAASLKSDGRVVVTQQVDVTRSEDLKALATTAEQQFGEVNLLFNNAGVCPMGSSWETSTEDWQRVLTVNVMGIVHGQQAFLPMMLRQPGPARIVNTGSIAGLFSNPGGAAYAVSKHAVVALSESLFMDLQADNSSVRVSVVCPGFVNTNLATSAGDPNDDSVPLSVRQGREALQRTLANGIAPAEIAERVFSGIDANQFWIFSQEDSLAGFDLRCASIHNRTDPSFVGILD